jgi:excisionase family DNA binding protein
VSLELELRRLIKEAVREAVAAELRDVLAALQVARPVGAGYLRVAAAAEYAGVHAQTVRGWVRDGKLVSYREGRVIRVRAEDLDNLLRETVAPGTIDFAERARAMRSKKTP